MARKIIKPICFFSVGSYNSAIGLCWLVKADRSLSGVWGYLTLEKDSIVATVSAIKHVISTR